MYIRSNSVFSSSFLGGTQTTLLEVKNALIYIESGREDIFVCGDGGVLPLLGSTDRIVFVGRHRRRRLRRRVRPFNKRFNKSLSAADKLNLG